MSVCAEDRPKVDRLFTGWKALPLEQQRNSANKWNSTGFQPFWQQGNVYNPVLGHRRNLCSMECAKAAAAELNQRCSALSQGGAHGGAAVATGPSQQTAPQQPAAQQPGAPLLQPVAPLSAHPPAPAHHNLQPPQGYGQPAQPAYVQHVVPPPPPPTLPGGWMSAVDKPSGKTYYYHPTTGETSWTPPHMAPPPPPLHAAHQPAPPPAATSPPAPAPPLGQPSKLDFETDVSMVEIAKPVKGVLAAAVASLVDAVKPIPLDLDDDAYFLTRKWSKGPPHGLTPDQAAAIELYTSEASPPEHSVYRVLNSVLRLRGPERLDALQPWLPYAGLLLQAVRCLPAVAMDVWRGIDKDVHTMFPVGAERVFWGFTSTMRNMQSIASFLPQTGCRTLFNCHVRSAVRIVEFSDYPDEDEMLLPPGTAFTVENNAEVSPGLWIIELREIDFGDRKLVQ